MKAVIRFLDKSAPILLFLAAILIWKLLSEYSSIPEYVIPSPDRVLHLLTSADAWSVYAVHTYATLIETILGLALAAATGLVFAFVISESPLLFRLTYPYIVALQCMPKVALAPLLVIWFGFGLAPKVVVSALLAFFPILVNTIAGIKSVRPEHHELFFAIEASKFKRLTHLVLPSAAPGILTGLELGIVVALLGAIVGEFVGAQKGLGVLLLQSQFQMDIAGVFAVLIILAAIGLIFNLLLRIARRRILFWIPAETSELHIRQ